MAQATLPPTFPLLLPSASRGPAVAQAEEMVARVEAADARAEAEEARAETEEALRLLAASAPEWCTLMGVETTVSGEELWRIKSQEFTVTRFVREKLVAMKQDKL